MISDPRRLKIGGVIHLTPSPTAGPAAWRACSAQLVATATGHLRLRFSDGTEADVALENVSRRPPRSMASPAAGFGLRPLPLVDPEFGQDAQLPFRAEASDE